MCNFSLSSRWDEFIWSHGFQRFHKSKTPRDCLVEDMPRQSLDDPYPFEIHLVGISEYSDWNVSNWRLNSFQKSPSPEMSRCSYPVVRPEPVWATDSYSFPPPYPHLVTRDPMGAVLFQMPPRYANIKSLN